MKYNLTDEIFSINSDDGYRRIKLTCGKWDKKGKQYDLRFWEGENPGEGLTITENELKDIYFVLNQYFGDGNFDNSSLCEDDEVYEDNDDNEIDFNEDENDKIYFHKFLIHSDDCPCLSLKHRVEKIKATVFIFNGYSNTVERVVDAYYCNDCDAYFITEKEYLNLKRFGKIMCQVYSKEDWIKLKDEKWNNLNPQSLLYSVGYSVEAKANLSDLARRHILECVIDSNLMSKRRVIDFLNWLKKTHPGETMMKAREKWTSDIQFLRGYETDIDKKKIGVKFFVDESSDYMPF